jgi:hypothetical protein
LANRVLRDWTQSENINNISESAEVFFVRLIMKADDYGCFYGNVKLIMSALYPLKEITAEQIEDYIKQCEKNKLIVSYVVDNKRYIKIYNFGQRLRVMKSKFPQPNDSVPLTNDSNRPLETKRNEEETKRNEYEKKGLIYLYSENNIDVFKEPKWDIEFTIDKDGQRIYGNGRERLSGGLSEIGIQEHCENRRIKYVK